MKNSLKPRFFRLILTFQKNYDIIYIESEKGVKHGR